MTEAPIRADLPRTALPEGGGGIRGRRTAPKGGSRKRRSRTAPRRCYRRAHEGLHRWRRRGRRTHRNPACRLGREVSALARGETLAALRTHGWQMKQGDSRCCRPPSPPSERARARPQDLVVIAVKAPVTAVAEAMVPLLGPSTIVLPAMNGVPWWFRPELAAKLQRRSGRRGRQGDPAPHVIGCVVHLSAADRSAGRRACTRTAWA